MWQVVSDYRKGVLAYFVVHKITGEVRGEFDCEPWAQEFAKELNREEEMPDK